MLNLNLQVIQLIELNQQEDIAIAVVIYDIHS